jgi:hypothetical protein
MPDEINGKLDEILDAVGTNTEELESIKSLLIGDIENEQKVGLVSRVRNLEKWYGEIRDDLRWIKRSFVGGIVIAIVAGVVIYVIQNYVL